jgi:formate-dependent nitrite reductase membrane component NrfD
MPGDLQIPHWQWLIVSYFFVGGIAGGAYFCAALVELAGQPEDRPIARMGYYIAFPLSLVCASLLIADLGRPESFWHMLVYSRTWLPWPKWDSPISVGAYALLFFGLFSFLSFADMLVETGRLPWAPLRLKYGSLPRRVYAVLGAFFGFFLASYTGVLISTTHLPMWSFTPMLGALFLASAASTGIAAIGLGLALARTSLSRTSLAALLRADNLAMVIEIVLLAVFVALVTGSGFQWSLVNLGLLIGGTLIVGLLVPLALQFNRGRQATQSTLGLTVLVASLVLLGGFVLRAAIVMGGQGLL